jgi:hypothetical protein
VTGPNQPPELEPEWLECYGGPLDGDRVHADLPDPLKVTVVAATAPGPASPVVVCKLVRRRGAIVKPIHVYKRCPRGHYHEHEVVL